MSTFTGPEHSSDKNNQLPLITPRSGMQRGHIEDEIARLELQLLQRRDSPHFRGDLDMVASLKSILMGILGLCTLSLSCKALRNEHRLIMDTLDHAIMVIDAPAHLRSSSGASRSPPHCPPTAPRTSSPFAGVPITRTHSGDHLESLVRKVQVAVAMPFDSPLGSPSPPNQYTPTNPSELSMSTYNYYCKYDLLDRAPLAPISDNLHPQHQLSPPTFNPTSPPNYAPSTKILDDELIKRMPKL